ncbi:MAG: hypothetical protein EXS18_05975 [Verrucomicrobiae bacterium]|nr:hypothetical protein [Verrucomicrobiae bacterium]
MACVILSGEADVRADDASRSVVSRRFLGSESCSSSGCHGGAAEYRNQNIIWARYDPHSRGYATLTTARSERLAEVLTLTNAATSTRCTVCHAPFHELPESKHVTGLDAKEGISCESCHAPAESWLRGHTRVSSLIVNTQRWDHADCVAAGMRDLKNLYIRANSCVACHQTVDTDLLEAGHPELTFELDGQACTMRKHWREKENWSGAQAWLVGQAVALREMSWQLSREPVANAKLAARWSGLLWVLQQGGYGFEGLPSLANIALEPRRENYEQALKQSDDLARRAAEMTWSPDMTRKLLSNLTAPSEAFRQPNPAREVQARRAERLVLGLERSSLTLRHTDKSIDVDNELSELFKLVQSLPDFRSEDFAQALGQFSQKMQPR